MPVQISQDQQYEWNGLLLGVNTPYDVVAVIGLGQPAVRELDVDRQDDHGSFPSRRELLQLRTINIELDVIATDPVDLFNKTAALRRAVTVSDDIRPLYFRAGASGIGSGYGEIVTSYGYVRQITANLGDQNNFNTNKWYIQIRCPDPRIYSMEPHSTSVSVASTTGGWTFPWTFPWIFGSTESGTINVVNSGAMDSPLIAQFNGPVTNPRLTNDRGEFVQFNLVIASGDYLEVNFRDKTALLNGTASRYNTRVPGSSWFPLRPGSNNIQYSAAAGDGQALLTWFSAWS